MNEVQRAETVARAKRALVVIDPITAPLRGSLWALAGMTLGIIGACGVALAGTAFYGNLGSVAGVAVGCAGAVLGGIAGASVLAWHIRRNGQFLYQLKADYPEVLKDAGAN